MPARSVSENVTAAIFSASRSVASEISAPPVSDTCGSAISAPLVSDTCGKDTRGNAAGSAAARGSVCKNLRRPRPFVMATFYGIDVELVRCMRRRAAAHALAMLIVCAAPLAAQDATAPPDPASDAPRAEQRPSDDKKPPTPEHTGIHALFRNLGEDYKNLAHLDNVLVAGVGGAAALAVHPWDPDVNAHLRSHYTLVNDIYAPAKYYGDTPEQVALSLGTYALGRIFDYPKASHLGMDLLRAQIVAESMVEPLKFAVG